MGQVLIEIPQNVRRNFRVRSSEYGEQLLKELEENTDTINNPAVIPPRRDSLKEDLAEVFGIWKDRPETAQEIARQIRDRNNGKNV